MIEDEGYSPIGRFSMEAGLFKKTGTECGTDT